MLKVSINLTKFYFYKIYTHSYLIIFIDKKLKMSLFAKNRDAFIILANKQVSNIIKVNTKYIYVF